MKQRYAALVFISLIGMAGVADAWAYSMVGRITGLRVQSNYYYITINDRSAGGYSNSWHRTVGEVCNVAKMAFDNGRSVKVEATEDPKKNNINDIHAIEMTWENITWPHYRP